MRAPRQAPATRAFAVALALAVLIGAPAPLLTARTKPGIRIEVVRADGAETAGELIAVRPASLIVQDEASNAYEFIPLDEVRIVRIPKHSHAAGAFNGFLQGAFYGAILGDLTSPKGTPSSGRRTRAFLGGTIGGAGLAVLGGIKGRQVKGTEVLQIRGQVSTELAPLLERLRGLARVKNAD